jgi:UDP-N-acetylmuramoyl-L-alanyl-D-glutamate--2,6-diaminopimelate ligase
MIIVGITGTKGKTSTSEFVFSVLSSKGDKVGLIGTAHTLIGSVEIPNSIHMTMPSPWVTQKFLKKMLDEGCKYAVLEVSSEGLKQYRHIGINYDIGVFTNLSPEHLPSHNNSFEEYKKAKKVLFYHIKNSKKKSFFNKKVSIVNSDSEFGSYYGDVILDKNIFLSVNALEKEGKVDFKNNIFNINNIEYKVNILGSFNIYNALSAYYVGIECGFSLENIKNGIEGLKFIPGRMEEIILGQDYRVFIDYAHEKLSMESLLENLNNLKKNDGKIIILFGAEGGGRDKRKRKDMALLADKYSDIIIISNTDPYEEDPQNIISDIASHITDKIKDKSLFLIEDRMKGIDTSFKLAKKDDIVCICGKGAEKTMVLRDKVIPWDERKIIRDVLNNNLK